MCLTDYGYSHHQLEPVKLPPEAGVIKTLLKVEAWWQLLVGHPDKWFTDFILFEGSSRASELERKQS